MIKYLPINAGADRSWKIATLRIKYQLHNSPIPIHDSEDAAHILRTMWDHDLMNIQEQIGAIYLNTRDEAVGFRIISSGKLNSATLDTPLLLSCGLLLRAKSIILCHNHPSGDPSPSRTDMRITIQLAKTVSLVGMELYDHIILATEGYHSMADARNFIPSRMMVTRN